MDLFLENREGVTTFPLNCRESAPFEEAGAAKVFDDGPLATHHRAEVVVLAAAIFLQIATPHQPHLLIFIHHLLVLSEEEAVDLGVPKEEEKCKRAFWLFNHDIAAAVASTLAAPYLLDGRADEPFGETLHRHVEKDEGEEESAHRPADPAGKPLAGDSSIGLLGDMVVITCFRE